MAATTLEELQVLITGETKGLRRELSEVQNQLNSTNKQVTRATSGIMASFKKLGGMIAGVFALKAVVGFKKAALQSASELETSMLGLQSILEGQGRSFERANQFIQEYIADGLVPLNDAVTAYKNLAARGYDDRQIQNVMKRLKDAAAFGRQSSYTLGEAVRSATEGLKNENSVLVDNAGVTKNVAKMWDEYARSIGKNANQLSQQEKIQAEVNGIMQETRFQVGDAAKYASTYAGRVAALSKTLRDVKRDIGQAFMPIANVVLPLLQTMANSVARVTSFIAQFMRALFGVNQAAAKSSEQVAQAQHSVADAVTEAGEAAKGSVTGFDEINQLADKQGAGGAGGVGGLSIPELEVDPEGGAIGGALSVVSQKAEEMAERVRGAFARVKDAVATTKNVVVPALGAIAGAVATAFAVSKLMSFVTFVQYIGALSGSSGLAALGATITHLASVSVTGLMTKLKGLWAAMAAHPVLLVAAAIGALVGAFVTAYKTNERFRAAIDSLVAGLKTALAPALGVVKGVLQDLWHGAFVPFGDFLRWIWQTVIAPLAGVLTDVLGAALSTVGSMALTLWTNVLAPLAGFLASVFTESVLALVEIFSCWWQNVLVPVASFLSQILRPAVEDISEVFTFLWQAVLLPLIEFVAGAFLTRFQDTTGAIRETINGLKTIFLGLIDFITGVFTLNWDKAWRGVRDIFKGIFDTLWSIVKRPLNLIIDGVNLLISGLNKISFSIPDWVPLVGGNSYGISIPRIPKLARGGIVDQPTIAMIGEQGREAVVPLENTGFVTSIANAVASAVGTALLQVQQLSGSNSTAMEGMELAIYMDTTKVAQATIPAIDRERSRTGLRAVIQSV